MGLKWTVLLFVGALLSWVNCLDWQGGGNFTQENLTTIRNKIFALDPTTDQTGFVDFAATLSDELGTLWAPAWNVVMAYYINGENIDAVLYGYGFKDHWFWFNGFQVNSRYVSFIIWKDFNCVKWITTNPADPSFSNSSFTTAQSTALTNTLSASYAARNIADIWLAAKDIQTKIPTAATTLLQDQLAYTVITTQSASTRFFSKVCVKDYFIQIGVVDYGDGRRQGAVLILQMRTS